jgi:hypothetical protein
MLGNCRFIGGVVRGGENPSEEGCPSSSKGLSKQTIRTTTSGR